MSVKIRIPAPLRFLTEKKDIVNIEATTIKEAVDALIDIYPELKTRIYKEDGIINRFMNIYLNEEDIRFLQNLDTPIKENDTISLLSAIAGG